MFAVVRSLVPVGRLPRPATTEILANSEPATTRRRGHDFRAVSGFSRAEGMNDDISAGRATGNRRSFRPRVPLVPAVNAIAPADSPSRSVSATRYLGLYHGSFSQSHSGAYHGPVRPVPTGGYSLPRLNIFGLE
ncbi:unnamed protein product [Calypogeia fissa]